MIIGKEKLNEIGRKLILRLRIDPGCRSKQYSNAYHDGIVVMSSISKRNYKTSRARNVKGTSNR